MKNIYLPFCIWGVSWTKEPLSLGGFSPSPWYARIWCRLENISAALLCWLHFGIKSTSANTNIINDNTPAIDIQTTFFVVWDFFDPPEFEASDADGPSACFVGVFPGVPEEGATKNGGDNDGGEDRVDGEVEGGNVATVELNGFPSFLQ